MSWLFAAAGALILSFGLVVLVGAPYLPTLNKQAEDALDLLALEAGQHLLDLGSGDGTMLIRAAKRGINSTGYELNPLLFVFSWLRTRRYRKFICIKWGNYWRKPWPTTDGVFVFLHTNFMQHLDEKLKLYAQGQPIRVVSYTFEIPNQKAIRQQGPLFLYLYGPLKGLHRS